MKLETHITEIKTPEGVIYSTLIDVTDGELYPTDAQFESDLTDEELSDTYINAIITLFVPGGLSAKLIAFRNDITNVSQHFEFRSVLDNESR